MGVSFLVELLNVSLSEALYESPAFRSPIITPIIIAKSTNAATIPKTIPILLFLLAFFTSVCATNMFCTEAGGKSFPSTCAGAGSLSTLTFGISQKTDDVGSVCIPPCSTASVLIGISFIFRGTCPCTRLSTKADGFSNARRISVADWKRSSL